MSLQHLTDFLADLRTIRPKINIDKKIGRKTSVLGLIQYLRNTVNNPQAIQSVMAARGYCNNPQDARITKYVPAIRRLISVWGRGNDNYPYLELNFAQINHKRLLGGVPSDVSKLEFDELQAFEDDPFKLHLEAKTTYLKTLKLDEDGSRLDITARSLLLCAGLLPPPKTFSDNGYLAKLEISPKELMAMRGGSILDVACGAAMFRAEMEALFDCDTTGIDLNAAHIDQEALNAGKERYATSMLYLKMQSDLGKLQAVNVSAEWDGLIDLAVENLTAILRSYEKNPPEKGDIFKLAENGRQWDFVTSAFLLCYFDKNRQTAAIQNMCAAARRAVFVTTGGSSNTSSPDLIYDQAAIRSAFPKCRIEVKSSEAHHIFLG